MSNLPIEHLSFSSLTCFLSNPWQFRKEWILGIRDRKTSPSMLVGSVVHLYAEQFYSGKEPNAAKKDALELITNRDLSHIDWGKTGSVEKAIKDANQAMNFFDLYCSGMTGIKGTEIAVTAGFDINGIAAPLPLKAVTDMVREDENGDLILVDWKIVASFSEEGEDDPKKIMQAIFNWYTIKAKYGRTPKRMEYWQIKKSQPRDGSDPVQVYVVDYSHQEYFKFFSRIYTGFIRLISDDDYCYLPNFSDILTAGDSWKDFTSEVLDFSQPKQVSHRSQQDVIVNTAGAKRVMAAQATKSNDQLVLDKLLEFGVVGELKNQTTCQFGERYQLAISKGVPVGKLKKLKEDIEFALDTDVELELTGKQELTITALAKERAAIKAPKSSEKQILNIGQSISGKNVVINLAKDPHVLIAGTTGAGKSYLMKNLISQTRSWSVVKIIDVKGEIANNAVRKDESAYKHLSEILAKVRAKTATPIVIFIDELGDLILSKTPIITGSRVVGKKETPVFEPVGPLIENILVRICQLGRSQGVHVVAATQRPSVKICTGILKANMPARVGLRVATAIDSQVIIDAKGCEKLVGNGDAYVVCGGEKVRTQCYA